MFKRVALFGLSVILAPTLLFAHMEEAIPLALVPILLAIKEENLAQKHALEDLKLCQKAIKRHRLNANRKIAPPGRAAPYGTVTLQQHVASAEQLAVSLDREEQILQEMGRREKRLLELKEMNITIREKLKNGEAVDPDAVELDVQKTRISSGKNSRIDAPRSSALINFPI